MQRLIINSHGRIRIGIIVRDHVGAVLAARHTTPSCSQEHIVCR
jgi:hypothetical protein